MERGKGEEQKKAGGTNEVVVMISGSIEEASKKQSGDAQIFTKLESGGSSSLSKNIRIVPPGANLTGFENVKPRVQMSNTLIRGSSSTERSELNQSPNKPRRFPDERLDRPRTPISSPYSKKPKSRFAEPFILYPNKLHLVEESSKLVESSPPYANSPHMASPTIKITDAMASTTPKEAVRPTPITPKTPLSYSTIGDDDDDDEVYKTTYLQEEGEKSMGNKVKFIILIEWIVFVCIVGILMTSLTVHKLRTQMVLVLGLEIWKWCVLVLVIFCGRLVTEWCVNVVVFLIERNFLLKKKVLYFVYGLKNSVRVFIWLALILLAWGLLINREVRRRSSRKTARILNYITRGIASSLIAAAMWIVKTLLLKLLASSFHVRRFFDRIQESIFHQYVLQTISGPPYMEYYSQSIGIGRSKRSSGQLNFKSKSMSRRGKQLAEKEEVIDVEKLHKIKQDKISAWTMGRLINIIRSSGLSTISSALDQSVVDEEEGTVEQKEITSEWEAKAAAARIFKNVAKPHHYNYIDEEDLLRFMNKEEADSVLPLFEGAPETWKISKKALLNWVVNVYNERKSLAHSLNDTKTAIEELNKVFSGIILVVIIIVWVLLMGLATTQVLVFISSQLLLLVFMFGNTCQTVFEAIIFVFVMHPFDVGDRCVIDGVQMVVEEMNILTTIFLRYDNEKISYPNSVLATIPISNFYRSPEMSDSVDFAVDVSTSAERIVALKSKIKAYIDSKPEHWRPKHGVGIKDIEDVNKMKMSLSINHTINFQNFGEKSNRRSDLVYELKKIFEELGIQYFLIS